MYFIHSIQTYTSVNRKGSEFQEYVLKLKDSLIKNREVLDDLKEELHCRIEELITYVEPADGEPHSPYSEKSPK